MEISAICEWKTQKIYRIFFILVLGSMKFYSPNFLPIPDALYKLFYYSMIIYFAYLSRNLCYKRNRILHYLILGVIVCQFISAINAYVYKGQDFIISMISTLQYVSFVVFIFLQRTNISLNKIEKLITTFSIIYIVLSIINRLCGYALFGTNEFDLDRGGMRYRLTGLTWVVLCFFMNVNRYSCSRRRMDLYGAIIMFIFIVSSLTRQMIGISLIVGILIYLHNTSWSRKLILIAVIAFTYYFVLPHISLAQKLIDKTEDQIEMNTQTDDIRILAFNYYAFEYPRNTMQKLFGVGIPAFGKSKYGNQFEQDMEISRLYREDVGYAGFYFNFGIIALVLILCAIFYALKLKVNKETIYAKYFLLSILLLSIASNPLTGTNQIVVIVVAFYIIIYQNRILNN